MKQNLIFIMACNFYLAGIANPISPLGINSISPEMLKDANLVKRSETFEVNIKSPAKAIVKQSYSYTILNAKGDSYAVFTAYYNKFQTINDIEGRLLDASGKELKKVKKKDISDMSGEAGMAISDTRYKQHDFGHTVYPYTVEYTCEYELNGIFWLPGWVPQESPYMGVLESNLVVKVPPGYNLRYKEYNFPEQVKRLTAGEAGVYSWRAESMKPRKPEVLMPSWARERVYVALAPSDFEIEGIKGNMDSWQQFGKFIYQLTGNRDALPPDMAMKAKQMTAGLRTPYEKIDTLYKYLQNNTRYISIQLGIGGWQPIPASKVVQTGYGDCKALTNYMYAMLREVGIESKYTLVNSEDDGLYTDAAFVSNQWDHVILSVPLAKDTIWLECTSNILPAGYLGDFTYNRPALIVDERGGTMVRTPTYKKTENLQIRNTNATVEDNGNISVGISTRYTGLQQDRLYGLYKSAQPDQVLKFHRNRFDIPTYDIVDYHYDFKPGIIPALHENINLKANGYAQVSGKRLFIIPNIVTRGGTKLPSDTSRFFDIELDYDYLDVDTVTIRVPEGFTVEALPKEVKETSRFGSYSMQITYADAIITVVRSVQQNSGRYPPVHYPELEKFYKVIQKADRAKVVLVKME